MREEPGSPITAHAVKPSDHGSRRFSLCAGAVLVALAGAAFAQYPVKPVHMIAPFPPGGTSDTCAPRRAKVEGGVGQECRYREMMKLGAKQMAGVVKAAGIQPE